MISLPVWAICLIAVAVVLSPVLAFLTAMAVEIVIGALVDAGALPIFAFVTAGAVGWLLLRNQCVRPRGRPPVEILKVEPHWPRKLGHMANGPRLLFSLWPHPGVPPEPQREPMHEEPARAPG